MSDNEFDERVDEVEELVAKLRANDRTVKSLCLDFETWEDVWDGNRDGDVKAKIDGDVVKLCRALEDNDVVRRLGIGSCGGFEGGEAIYGRGAKAIARLLKRNRSVEEVIIYCCSFYGQSEMKKVLEGLIGNQTITKLTITGHGGDDEPPPTLLGESLCRVLAKVLRKSTSIKELALVDEAIDWDEGLDLICDGLRKNQSIKSLDLLDGYFFSNDVCAEHNWLATPVCAKLCSAIGNDAKIRLKTLITGHASGIDFISNHRNIHELHLVFCLDLTSGKWNDLAKALSKNNSVKTLVLSNINDERRTPETIDWRTRTLFEAIASGSVESLTVKGMPLDDAGVGIICKALRGSTSIREFTVFSCGKKMTDHPTILGYTGDPCFTATSVKAIANLLKSSSGLETVRIDSRYDKYTIGDEGAVAIAKALAKRRVKTKQLVLKNCDITDKGGVALCRLLESPRSSLEVLGLGGNNFGLATVTRFIDCLSDNSTLRTLHISDSVKKQQRTSTSEKVDLQLRLFNSLKTNHTLSKLQMPWMDTDNMSLQQKLNLFAAFREMLQVNHTIDLESFYEYARGLDDEVMRSANKKHPVLASTLKSAPFPSHLVGGISVSLIPDAIERVDDVAGVDGVFSLLRKVGDSIWDGIVPPEPAKKTKKRRRKQ